jgi:hypothetical protein
MSSSDPGLSGWDGGSLGALLSDSAGAGAGLAGAADGGGGVWIAL